MSAGIEWSTQQYSGPERSEAWQRKLTEVYSRWTFDCAVAADFRAGMQHRALAGFQIADCECDPCSARRSPTDMATDAREVLAIQLVMSGREHITLDGEDIVLGPGDLLIWDTTRPMSFRVLERLHKISVMMPLARLQSWLPRSWHSIRHKIDRGSAQASLLSAYVRSVSPGFISGAFSEPEGLTEAAIGLLVNALNEPRAADPTALRDTQLQQVHEYIDAHLDDPELTPTLIAQGMRISVRYLHWLFKPSATTALQYLIQQRLLRCRRELANPRMDGRKITDIAFSSGFQNATHFARRFKAEFGSSPQDFRAALRGQIRSSGPR